MGVRNHIYEISSPTGVWGSQGGQAAARSEGGCTWASGGSPYTAHLWILETPWCHLHYSFEALLQC